MLGYILATAENIKAILVLSIGMNAESIARLFAGLSPLSSLDSKRLVPTFDLNLYYLNLFRSVGMIPTPQTVVVGTDPWYSYVASRLQNRTFTFLPSAMAPADQVSFETPLGKFATDEWIYLLALGKKAQEKCFGMRLDRVVVGGCCDGRA